MFIMLTGDSFKNNLLFGRFGQILSVTDRWLNKRENGPSGGLYAAPEGGSAGGGSTRRFYHGGPQTVCHLHACRGHRRGECIHRSHPAFTDWFLYQSVLLRQIAFTFVSPAGNPLGYYAVLVPVVGGLIVGLMARYGSERIRGHGIPEAIDAIWTRQSRIEPRVAVLKPISAAISIGSGGPFGAEGPIIMTGGAFGSVFAQFLHLSAMERKTLLVAGAAAGMAATFNSPLAAVLLAVELLLFEWKPREPDSGRIRQRHCDVTSRVALRNESDIPRRSNPDTKHPHRPLGCHRRRRSRRSLDPADLGCLQV